MELAEYVGFGSIYTKWNVLATDLNSFDKQL